MVDYREILRLASEPRNSQRQIAASVGSSHHTVKEVVETARLKGIEWPLEETVSKSILMIPRCRLIVNISCAAIVRDSAAKTPSACG